SAFSVRDNPFEVIIDRSRFSLSEIDININNKEQAIDGLLKLNNMYRWPREELSPGVMGPFSFIPFLECYHGVISMDHSVKGSLNIDGKHHDFTGRGYMEKDWGNSFPGRWIWMQTNGFRKEGVSLFLSIATIPRMGREFTGLISGLLINNRLYRFATYTGARIRHLYAGKSDIQIILQDKRYKMEIRTTRPRGGSLKSPISGNMEGRVNESVNAEIRVKLITRQGFPVFTGRGRNAGLEVEW
ncbi:MAG: tocopherol cyclase family protein, partial [bacterium]